MTDHPDWLILFLISYKYFIIIKEFSLLLLCLILFIITITSVLIVVLLLEV